MPTPAQSNQFEDLKYEVATELLNQIKTNSTNPPVVEKLAVTYALVMGKLTSYSAPSTR